MPEQHAQWFVYILLCADQSLYTGITNNLERRLHEHQTGVGAKYTKGRSPLTMVYHEECENRSAASKREIQIKALSKPEKLNLIKMKP